MSVSRYLHPAIVSGTCRQSRLPVVVVVGTAAILLFLILRAEPGVAVIVLLTLPLVLVGLIDSRWLITGLVAFTAMVPIEMTIAEFFGYEMRNPLQFVLPGALAVCLVRGLKNRNLPRPIVADALLVLFGLWGLASLLNAGGLTDMPHWKKYGNKMLYPMGFYFIVRMVPLDHEGLLRLIKTCAVCVAVQSVLMVMQARAGESSIYSTHDGFATGPFVHFWTAATYMVMWPSLLLYLSAASKSSWGRGLSIGALILNAYAVTRTGQRAATALIPLIIGICLISPGLRRTAATALLLGMLLYIPWSMSGAGGAMLDRFDETDESRAAYRAVAMEMLRSPSWDPIFGVGPWLAQERMQQMDASQLSEGEFLMWGSRQRSLAEVAERGSPLHNVFIALLLEFGSVGAILGLAIAAILVRSVLQVARSPESDDALLTAIIGALAAFAGRGFFHNVYSYTAPMCLMFFWYGVIVGHPHAFKRDRPDALRSM